MIYSKSKMERGEQSILTTLLYSDIFAFPLTKAELWQFLISSQKITNKVFEKELQWLLQAKKISTSDGCYCLPGKEASIVQRKANLSEVKRKKILAQNIAEQLAKVSSVLFIGVSGGLAAKDVTPGDDIDLFIVVKKNTLYTSRMLILILLERMGYRRSRNQKDTADMFCVNLLVDETALAWPKEEQDIYTAREIAQLYPLYQQQETYQKFLQQNRWIEHYLPNALLIKQKVSLQQSPTSYRMPMGFFEKLMRFIQISYMKRHRTTETVLTHRLAFHPHDYRIKTRRKLTVKMRQYGLLTKI